MLADILPTHTKSASGTVTYNPVTRSPWSARDRSASQP